MDWGWLGVAVLGVLAAGLAVFVLFAVACLIADLLNEWRD